MKSMPALDRPRATESTMIRTAFPLRRFACALIAAALAGACAGESPADPLAATSVDASEKNNDDGWDDSNVTISSTSELEGPFVAAAVIRCDADRIQLTVVCTSPQDPDPNQPPPFGGRGVHARMMPAVIQYLADANEFRVRMRVRNLLPQVIGSEHGPITGMKVFFHQAPTVLTGSGNVSVINAHGTGEFTAPNQPYFAYNERIDTDQTTFPTLWRFSIDPTVTRFRFRLYVSSHLLPLVVFDMEAAGNRDIYRVNVDGTGLQRLTSHPAVESSPTVNNDRIVYVSYRNGNADLYSISLFGGAESQVTNTGFNETQPDLSRNGRLAYVSDQTALPRIWNAEADGSLPAMVPSYGHGGAIVAQPTWQTNPVVVFTSSADGPANLITAHRTAGGAAPLLPPEATPPNFEARFNRLGDLMTYVSTGIGSTAGDVWVFDPATTARTRITDRAEADIQPALLHDNSVAWIQQVGANWRLQRRTLDGSVEQTVLNAAPGERNIRSPVGVPLR
jgi:hypothetical protein